MLGVYNLPALLQWLVSNTKNPDKHSFDNIRYADQQRDKMSSFKTNFTIAKILCIVCMISLMGSKCAVDGGVVISGASLSNNRPPYLVSAASSIHTATVNGQISQAEAHKQTQNLIQANKNQVNLALIHGIGKK